MSGTTVKPVGIERQQPIKKSPNQIFKKSSRQPRLSILFNRLVKFSLSALSKNTIGVKFHKVVGLNNLALV